MRRSAVRSGSSSRRAGEPTMRCSIRSRTRRRGEGFPYCITSGSIARASGRGRRSRTAWISAASRSGTRARRSSSRTSAAEAIGRTAAPRCRISRTSTSISREAASIAGCSISRTHRWARRGCSGDATSRWRPGSRSCARSRPWGSTTMSSRKFAGATPRASSRTTRFREFRRAASPRVAPMRTCACTQ